MDNLLVFATLTTSASSLNLGGGKNYFPHSPSSLKTKSDGIRLDSQSRWHAARARQASPLRKILWFIWRAIPASPIRKILLVIVGARPASPALCFPIQSDA